jgi:atypical dual specificity phosphatase
MLFSAREKWTTILDTISVTNGRGNSSVRSSGRPYGTASLVVPRLYLSGYQVVCDAEEMKSLGITHVISILDFEPDISDIIEKDNKLHITLSDLATEDLIQHFSRTTEFIERVLEENDTNRILVSCNLPSVSSVADIYGRFIA